MKTRTQKEKDVKVLAEKFGKSKSVVFTNYQGLTMKQLSELRQKLSDQEAEFTVAKNTLIDIALKQAGKDSPADDVKSGPTALMLAYGEEITPIKTLVKSLKDAAIGQIKGGFLGEELLDALSIDKLANLPSKKELQAKVVGVLAAPLQGMVGVLQGNLRNLVYVLSQIQDKRQDSGRTS